jgi:hypothetical protein
MEQIIMPDKSSMSTRVESPSCNFIAARLACMIVPNCMIQYIRKCS